MSNEEDLQNQIRQAEESLENLKKQEVASKATKSDLEKAHYAAAIFAKSRYQGSSVWFVEEVSTTYTQHGTFLSESEEKNSLIRPKRRDRVRYRIVDHGLLKNFDPDTGYLIARSLERGD